MRQVLVPFRLGPLLLLLAGFASAQNVSIGSTQQDPGAVAVLNKLAAVLGWDSTTIIPTYKALVERTVYDANGSPQRPTVVTVQHRPGKYRVEDQNGFVFVFDGTQAVRTQAGKIQTVPTEAAASVRPLLLMAARDEWSNPAACIKLEGTENISGEPASRLRMGCLEKTAIRLWIRSRDSMPVQASDSMIAADNPSARVVRIHKFIQFQQVGSLAFPVLEEEWVNGKKIATIAATGAVVDEPISDSVFDTTAVQQ